MAVLVTAEPLPNSKGSKCLTAFLWMPQEPLGSPSSLIVWGEQETKVNRQPKERFSLPILSLTLGLLTTDVGYESQS